MIQEQRIVNNVSPMVASTSNLEKNLQTTDGKINREEYNKPRLIVWIIEGGHIRIWEGYTG